MLDKFENDVIANFHQQITTLEQLKYVIDFIRPTQKQTYLDAIEKINFLIDYMQSHSDFATQITSSFNQWIIKSRISTNIATLGILSKEGFRQEISNRFYNKFLPSPPKDGDFKYLFSQVFQEHDELWIHKIGSEIWVRLFAVLFKNEEYSQKSKNHLFDELLYAIEILSIWIASEEFDENFIRLDNSLLDKDSAFIALQRDIVNFVRTAQSQVISIENSDLDFQHIHVLIDQCRELILSLKKKSVNLGTSVTLTYEFERLEQIIVRLEDLLELIKIFDSQECYISLVGLFKKAIEKNSTRNSISEIWNKNIKILARSITNNASEHGEHYVTSNKSEYIKMLLSASGAGIAIAFMALVKIYIVKLELPIFLETVLISLDYGLGFVIIHLLGFTVATKQPAMTASTFANAVEKGSGNKANQAKLVELMIQVSRSQFAAVVGNVTLALGVAFLIGYFYISNNTTLMSVEEAQYHLGSFDPYPSLLYAAIAGIWLFCSGLIAGYYDNRANYLDLRNRYLHHPWLKKITSKNIRVKFSNYLHDNHGALVGNFLLGVLLGFTPFLGYIFELPLDVRHVTLSTAYLGLSSSHISVGIVEFITVLCFILMIGFVNLSVSFILALKVALKSRDAYFGSVVSFIRLFAVEAMKRPRELFLPVNKKEEDKKNEEV
jgi:site-specific recombinase